MSLYLIILVNTVLSKEPQSIENEEMLLMQIEII